MTYATPAQLIRRFGATEAAQLLADEERLLTEQLLRDAIAGTWTGSPSAEAQAAALAALQRLQDALQAASTYIDGYLRAVATLPLLESDPNWPVLSDCCLALTRVSLADDPDNATELMQDAAAVWRTWLRDVAAGRVALAPNPAAPVPSAPGGGGGRIHFGQAVSAYPWARFGGVR